MNVLSPTEWGARVDYDKWTDKFSPDDGVALHHGGGSDYPAGNAPYSLLREKAQLQAWERFHIDVRGWRGLAYGWAVGQTGTIYRARGFNTYGAHTGDVDGDGIANNAEVVPILFIGSGNHHVLSKPAQDAIEWLRRDVIQEKSPKATWLYGHQELRGTVTACPGPRGMEYVRANRQLKDEEPRMWTHPKKPGEKESRETSVLDLADADAVAEYQGSILGGENPASFFGGNPDVPEMDFRRATFLTIGRLIDQQMRDDLRMKAGGH